LLLATFTAFALVLLFLFSARSLQVQVIATAPADIDIDGFALPFGDRYLLLPGEYGLEVGAEGYHSLQRQVTVDDTDGQVVEVVLEPLPGVVSVFTTPPGARLSIDGEMLGRTPLEDLALAAGVHQLLLEEARHLPLAVEADITGREVYQELSYTLAPAWADVTLNSLPPGATILVDGEAVGTTPASLEILQGERQLMLRLDAYADWQQDLEVVAGQARDLGVVELQAAPGELSLQSSPPGANVTLDGEFQGQTPLVLALTPDREHRLAVFKPGYRRHSSTVSLPAAATDTRTVTLRARLGEVRLQVAPDNAVVRVDGRPVGTGSRTLSLPAVEHSVEVSLDGHATARRRVTPRPGLPQQLDITLLTQQQARMAGIKRKVTTSLGQELLLFKPQDSQLADFTMGASRREPGRRSNEVLHPVGLRRMFYLQTTEVTNAQFRQFLAGHSSGQVSSNSLNREHQPVVQVSWQQAASFCNWLSRREGLAPFYSERQGIITGFDPDSTGYRLPSEAEWAWAARASGETLLKFPWGDRFPPTAPAENYADNSSAYVTGRVLNNYNDGQVVSATVGSFGPNQNGLYDMGGNVAEWVHDVYAIPSADGQLRIDPLGAASGDNYVIRGASWAHAKIGELRLSYRDYGQAGRDDVGFRIARYAE
jgi:formylglycine-generating enzyme required for sulfatase activity